jgi:hypothetical protein
MPGSVASGTLCVYIYIYIYVYISVMGYNFVIIFTSVDAGELRLTV